MNPLLDEQFANIVSLSSDCLFILRKNLKHQNNFKLIKQKLRSNTKNSCVSHTQPLYGTTGEPHPDTPGF